MSYPTALDTGSSLPTPNTSDHTNSPSHAALHGLENTAIIATETKLGTGSSTPASNTLLFGTGAGTSAWQALTSAQLAAVLSDETGTGSAVFATSPTLITPKVDTINESTPSNGTTIGGVNIKSGALNTNNSVVTANITDSAVTYAKVATGFVVQVVNTNYGAVATGTTVIPIDDTLPQNTEGDQYMTQAIIPKSTTNILIIEAKFQCSISVAQTITAALFQDSTANALAVSSVFQATSTGNVNIILSYSMTAGTTSSTTFKVRGGPGAAGTLTFNGSSGTRQFGGAIQSFIKITEYKA